MGDFDSWDVGDIFVGRGGAAWPFYRTISGVRLCCELEEPKGPKGVRGTPRGGESRTDSRKSKL